MSLTLSFRLINNLQKKNVLFDCRSDSSYNGRIKESIDEIDSSNYNRVREEPLRINGCEQILAILYKKGIYMRERWIYWLMLFSIPIAAIAISFFSINYKLFTMGDTQSRKIDLRMGQIASEQAEILIWIQEALPEKDYFQKVLHKVIEEENVGTKYLSYPWQEIEKGE